MLDPKTIRKNPDDVKKALLRRGYHFDIDSWSCLEATRKDLQKETEDLKSSLNSISNSYTNKQEPYNTEDEVFFERLYCVF